MNNDVHPVFRPLIDFLGGRQNQQGDCPHGRPSHEHCEDCEESDAEELAL